MSKNFNDVWNEIKSNVSTSSTGKPVKSFSRSDFDRMAKAWLNTPDYKFETVSTKDGQPVISEVFPVEKFRGMIRRVLIDFGVDKQDVEAKLAEYEFKNVDGLYELCSELVYKYIEAGKKFDFMPRMDFIGSVILDEIGESTKTHRGIKDEDRDKTYTVKKKAHKVAKARSKCPEWLRDRT